MRSLAPSLLLLALPALSGAQDAAAPEPMPAPVAADEAPAGQGAAMGPAMDHSGMASTGEPDVDSVQGMILHHEGAVVMAQDYLRDGADPALRAMAQKMTDDQNAEIGMMREWLAAGGD